MRSIVSSKNKKVDQEFVDGVNKLFENNGNTFKEEKPMDEVVSELYPGGSKA